MTDLFLDVLNTSFAATWVVMAVVVARLFLKKAPRWMVCGLWALVAARLLIGGGITAPFSLIPSAEVIPPQSLYEQAPAIHSGVPILDNSINPVYTESLRPTPGASVNPLQVWTAVFANLWILGVAAMVLWAAISWLRVRRQVRESIPAQEGVYLCDRIASPFIFGLLRPRIYLPSDLSDYARSHVIAHEKAHLRRRDHWWKPLGFGLLTVNWFNPAMWLAYILLCRDIEMACDEKVIRDFGAEEKKAYSAALLRCSVNSRRITACPLAFGEVGVKARVKSVLNYKKPAFWVILVTVVLTAVLALGLLTSPTDEAAPAEIRWNGNLYIQSGEPTDIVPDKQQTTGVLKNILPDSKSSPTGDAQAVRLNRDYIGQSIVQVGNALYLKEPDGEGWLPFRLQTEAGVPDDSGSAQDPTDPSETEDVGLGIIMELENITPDGATLVCTQDGTLWSDITTGANWNLMRYENGQLVSLLPESMVWTTEAYPIPTGESRSFELNWGQLIGSLEPGWYQIGKTFSGYEQITLHQSAKEPFTETRYVIFEINPLGISLHMEDITPGGGTLVCTHRDTTWEHITTGADWTLERLTGEGWVSVLPEDTTWTAISIGVNLDNTTSWNLNWEQIVGELEPGKYRIGKNFMGFGSFTVEGSCAVGEGTQQTCYADFIIGYYETLPDFSPELYQAVRDDWIAYDAMDEFDRLASSKTPGICAREFDSWAEVEAFVGMEIANPLEGLESLEKGNWAAAPEGYNGGSRFYVTFSGTREGQIQSVNVQSGYHRGDLRVALDASLPADGQAQPLPAGQILHEDGDGWEARTTSLIRGPIEYTLRVMGDPGTGDELTALLQELLPCFEANP